ncbi:hypothetical protein C8J56DRAFT_1046472 [Mycena floridula]|nr:hypothetical protein C8J56DRAFT_1046472 [Mycena floridula]
MPSKATKAKPASNANKPATTHRRAQNNAAKNVIQDAAKPGKLPKLVLRRLTRSQSPAEPDTAGTVTKSSNSFTPLAATIEGDKEDSIMGDESNISVKAVKAASAEEEVQKAKDFPPLRPATPVQAPVADTDEIVETPNGKMTFAQAIKSIGRIPKVTAPHVPNSPSISGSASGPEDFVDSDDEFDLDPKRLNKGKGKAVEGFSPFSSPEPEVHLDKSPKRMREEDEEAGRGSSPFTFSRDGSPVNLFFDEDMDKSTTRHESPMQDSPSKSNMGDPAGDRTLSTKPIYAYMLPAAPSPFMTKPRLVRTPPKPDDEASEQERQDIHQAKMNSLNPAFAGPPGNQQASNVGATSSRYTLDLEQRPANPTPSAKRLKASHPEQASWPASPQPAAKPVSHRPALRATATVQVPKASTPPPRAIAPHHRFPTPPPRALTPPPHHAAPRRQRSPSVDEQPYHLHISRDGTRVDGRNMEPRECPDIRAILAKQDPGQKRDWKMSGKTLLIVDLIGERSEAKPARPFIEGTIRSVRGCRSFEIGPLNLIGGKPTQYYGLLSSPEFVDNLRSQQYIAKELRLITFEISEAPRGRTHIGVITGFDRVFWGPIDAVNEEDEDAIIVDGAPAKPVDDGHHAMNRLKDQVAQKIGSIVRSVDGQNVMTKNINPVDEQRPVKEIINEMLESTLVEPTLLSNKRPGIAISLVRPVHSKDNWRDDLRKLILGRPIITGGYGSGYMISKLLHCDICGGTNHITDFCRLPTFPGWTGPTISSVADIASARTAAKETKEAKLRNGNGRPNRGGGRGYGGKPDRERRSRHN